MAPTRPLRSSAALWRYLALGPNSQVPPGAHPARLRSSDFAARLWTSRLPEPRTTVVLLPGLHMDGPADSRMERLAQVLRLAGAHVIAPHIRPFEALTIGDAAPTPEAIQHTLAAFDWVRAALPTTRVGVFSVSFGSILALHLMARRPIDRAVLFGAYSDLPSSLAYALDGEANPGRDPLNGPAIYQNVAEALLAPAAVSPFREACRAFCARTWSRSARPALKGGRRFAHVLASVAAPLPPPARDLLYEATGLLPGGAPRILAALEASQDMEAPFAWADPAPLLGTIDTPVTLVHGRDDDVIPCASALALAKGLRNSRAWITGAWSHTGATQKKEPPSEGPLDMLKTSLAVMRAMDALVNGG